MKYVVSVKPSASEAGVKLARTDSVEEVQALLAALVPLMQGVPFSIEVDSEEGGATAGAAAGSTRRQLGSNVGQAK